MASAVETTPAAEAAPAAGATASDAARDAKSAAPASSTPEGEGASSPESADGDPSSEKDAEASGSEGTEAPSDAEGADAAEATGTTVAADAADAAEATDAKPGKPGKPSKRASVRAIRKPKHLALWIAAAIVALIVIAVALFSWDRWLRYDDAADLQGQWHIADSANVVTIDEGSIHLTDKEAYAYAMDSGAKTLTFTFGDLSGQARYRFSADRTQVAIQDGSFGMFDTITSDIAWSWSCLIGMITGQPQTSPSLGEGSLVLSREPEPAQEQPAEGAETPEGQQATPEEGSAEQPAAEEQPSAEEQAATEEQAAAEAEAAAEEQRRNELRIEEALTSSGGGSVGSNALSPEDLM